MGNVIFWISIIGPLFIALCGIGLARRRNRSRGLWFFNCWLLGLIALLILACSRNLEYDEELNFQESDTLGRVVFVLAIIAGGLCIWWGYEAARQIHDQMWWNFMMDLRQRY